MRALCRLADAWRFVVRHVAGPTIAFGTVDVILFCYLRHEAHSRLDKLGRETASGMTKTPQTPSAALQILLARATP